MFDSVAWQTEEGETWIRLTGELDIASIGRLERVLSDALTSAAEVVVDLRQLSFIDGAGLGALVSGRARAGIDGRKLTLVRGAHQFDALLRATGLDELFETIDYRASESSRAEQDTAEVYLECPRCGLMLKADESKLEDGHCPRCLGRSQLQIPMGPAEPQISRR